MRGKLVIAAVCLAAAVCLPIIRLLPKPALTENYGFSTAVYDRNGRLLRLNLSDDDKYRVRLELNQVPDAAKKALLLYEDRWFYYHFGVNPFRTLKALVKMAVGGRKQGASTITMQVARQIYHIDSSTISGKLEQMFRAVLLEVMYSKDEILEAYFNISPYGGNIEGIGAAALVYFGCPAEELDVLQSIILTVIPQNPSQRALFSAKGRQAAEKAAVRLKRKWLSENGNKDAAILDLPIAPIKKLPFLAPHIVQGFKVSRQEKIVTAIDADYQQMLEEIVARFIGANKNKGIENAAALIADYKSGEILASAGSAGFFNKKISGQVDGTKSLRSPGSTLKPFIFALALDEGIIHPLSMLKDVPRNYGLYTPENFDKSFYGLLNATEALVYSRNVPAVDLLKSLKKDSFYHLLQQAGVKGLQPPEFYGLALALGGAEMTMEDLASLYAMLGNYGKFRRLSRLKGCAEKMKRMISPEAAYLTLKMLAQNPVPDEVSLPYQVKNKKYEAYWKTGTSYGFRDAWTAGLAGDYVVVAWVGNFDGTPNNNFVGRTAAAPLFFDVVKTLYSRKGFKKSLLDKRGLNIRTADICKTTGDLADKWCMEVVEGDFIPGVTSIKMSSISRVIPVNVQTGKRACRHLPPLTKLERFEFWPSDVRKAFNEAGITVKQPPEFEQNCLPEELAEKGNAPQIVFPAANSSFLLRSKQAGGAIIPLRSTADADVKKIYWFVNQNFVGETVPGETLTIHPDLGVNMIKAADNLGREQEIKITVKFVD